MEYVRSKGLFTVEMLHNIQENNNFLMRHGINIFVLQRCWLFNPAQVTAAAS